MAEALAQMGRALAGTLKASDRVVYPLLQLFQVRSVALWELDPVSDALVCVAIAGVSDPERWRGQVLPAGSGTAGLAAAEVRPIWTADLPTDARIRLPAWAVERTRDEGIGSAAAVPLQTRGEVLGALSLGDAPGRPFEEDDLRLLAVFADQAALALANARLREETQQRLRQTETLLAVSQSVGSTLDLTETMRRVARETGRAIGADTVSACVSDPDGTVLRPLAGHHVPKHLLDGLTQFSIPLKGHHFVIEAWDNQRPVASSDAPADPRIEREMIVRFPHRSLLFVPMLSKGDVIGGLFAFWWDQKHFFTPAELRLADGIGRQAALALDRTRLHEQTERRRRAADRLAELGRLLAQSLDPDVVAHRIADSIRTLLGVQSSALFRLEAGSGELVPVAISGDIAAAFGENGGAPPGAGVARLAALGRGPVTIPDVLTDPNVALAPEPGAPVGQTGRRAALGVPLLVRDQVIGALGLDDRPGRRFDPEEAQLAQAFADQAAIAIENARLYEDTERRRREAESLAELAQSINASLDLDTVLQRAVERARDLCGSDAARIALREPGSDSAVFRYWAGARPEPPEAASVEPGKGIGGQALLAGHPVRTDRHAEDHPPGKDDPGAARREGMVSSLVVPIPGPGRVEGLLYVSHRSPRPFTDRDQAILVRLADQVAIAIRNAQLYASQEVRAVRLDTLARLNRVISSSLDTDTVLQEIARAAATLMEVPVVSFWVADEARQTLEIRAFSDDQVAHDFPLRTLRFGEGSLGCVARHRQLLHIPDALADDRILARAWWQRHQLRSFLGIPIVLQDSLLGVLSLNGRAPFQLQPAEQDLLQSFVAQAAAAIRNARLYEERTRAAEELSRTEHQLLQAQKMEAVGRLAGGVAHDFNNLLTVIGGRSELLLQRLRPGEPLRRHAELIEKTAKRAATLTQQLLAFSRKQMLQPKVLDLNAVVADTSKILRRLIGEDIELVMVTDPALGRVEADPGQLAQVILNLAVNARDAMPRGGRLILKTANVELDDGFVRHHAGGRSGSHVMLEVSDTGIGMDAETRSHLFEPFFTTKGPGEGTGLGLATVYGIVKQSGGYVEVQSEPGRGTTFKIYLPRVEEVAGSLDAGPAAQDVPSGLETVLLVEDEEDVRDLAREILEMSGYTVLEARHGREALAVNDRHAGPIHLLLTDVVMPEMGGRALADHLGPRRPEMRALYMSGYTGDALGRHGVLEANVALLRKPFTPEVLARRVREVLDSPSQGARDR